MYKINFDDCIYEIDETKTNMQEAYMRFKYNYCFSFCIKENACSNRHKKPFFVVHKDGIFHILKDYEYIPIKNIKFFKDEKFYTFSCLECKYLSKKVKGLCTKNFCVENVEEYICFI